MIKNTQEFIEKAKNTHKDRYEYNETLYINSTTKVKVECKKHGVFTQIPYNHIKGQGCPNCGIETISKKNTISLKSNTKEFIIKAQKIHNHRYDYSLTEYISAKDKVKIICREHGIFEQTPNNHLLGKGCKKCSIQNNIKCQKKTTQKFIEQCVEKYGDRFIYSMVEYKGSNTKVKIICKTHGVFKVNPANFLNTETTNGCKKCHNEYLSKLKTKNISVFIKQAKEVHGDKYDYSPSIYTGSKNNILINCYEHGIFSQNASNHLFGDGCPKCGTKSSGEIRIRNYLLKNKIKHIEQKSFKNCVYKKKLFFDFFLTNNNILIEYNGEQHYSQNRFFHKNKNSTLEIQKKKDQIKRDFATKNNIILIEIPYWEKNNIELILKKALI
jgi:hypothetical protein